MKAPFSQNELPILDRQMAKLNCELAEIVSLFESRLGEANDFAVGARSVAEGFAALARKVHMQYKVAVGDDTSGLPKKEIECRKRNQPEAVTH
jgi:hypothetical protein